MNALFAPATTFFLAVASGCASIEVAAFAGALEVTSEDTHLAILLGGTHEG